jgi:hypothetical protein
LGSPAAAVAGDAATLGAVSSDESERKREKAERQMDKLLAEMGYTKEQQIFTPRVKR